ncbi:hypothetical protein VTI74DRAFT_8810 [Chaetomium olivicolor]
MASRSLYDEALDRFRKDAAERYSGSNKEIELLNEFQRERASPEETKKAAEALQADAGKKWGSRKVGDVEIPESWIANIMGNIEYFVAAGDFVTKNAPESVGMAWYAVKLTLTAIHSNYDLYTFFGSGLSDISEIMIIVRHYDRLYDERNKPQWKPSPLVEKLFQDVISAYAAVLDFSFAIKRHLTAGALTRIKHGFKDFFGLSKVKFEDKLSAVASFKAKILEESQGAFQDKTLTQLENVSTVLAGIEDSVRHIQEFQDTQKKLHEDAMARFDVLIKGLDDIRASTKRKSRWDYAVQDFQKYQDALSPLEGSFEVLGDIIDDIYPGTCQWVFENWLYKRWLESTENTMLCVTGPEGSGKSYVVASVAARLTRADDPGRALLFVPCRGSSTTAGLHGQSHTAESICHTLMSQIYDRALQGEDNVDLLEACNAIFRKAKANHNALPAHMRAGSGLPDFADGVARLANLLKMVSVVIVLDGVDNNALDNKNQQELLRKLRNLLNLVTETSGIRIKILVACAPSTRFFNDLDLNANSYIDLEYLNRQDIQLLLTETLKDIPGLTKAEQETAKATILEKARARFLYIRDTAIPFMQEPFQRPISQRLEALPDGRSDVYAKALRKMSPNYLDLLRTALSWTLLCPEYPGFPHAREIMDAFHGTYDISSEVDLAEEAAGFGPVSRLELEQLRVASDGFLKLWPMSDGVVLVTEADAEALNEYFVKAGGDVHEDQEQHEQLCPRCGSSQSAKSLFIDPKEEHLQMTLMCLRHLNNPLFQRRAGLLAFTTVQQERQEGKGADAETADGPCDNSRQAAPKSEERPESRENARSDENVEGNADAEHGADSGEEEIGYVTEGSVDDEEIAHRTYYDHTADEYLNGATAEGDDEEPEFIRVRYEIQFWPWHLRQAEERWPDEERENSSDWESVMAELDKLVFETPAIFAAWQDRFPEDPDPEDLGLFRLKEGPHKPLHVAAYLGLTSWVKHLLGRGEDLNGLSEGYSALQAAACAADRLETMRFLLERGANINAENGVDRNAFHYWMMCGERTAESVRVLLEHGADPTITDSRCHYTPLNFFANKGEDPGLLELLVAHGADINAIHPEARGLVPPLHHLLIRPDVPLSLLEAFMKHGADTNSEAADSSRPLQLAVLSGQLEALEVILGSKILDIDDRDDEGTTALHQAAFLGFDACVRKLLEHGADPDIPDKLARTALHSAARKGLTETVQVLLGHTKHANLFDKHGWSPLFCACLSKVEESAVLILDDLVKLNVPLAEINRPTRSGRTVLRQAADHGFDRVVSKLIQLAADRNDAANLHINARESRKGMTPLHRATLNGHAACVRALLSAHPPAEASLTDAHSRTALGLAYNQWTIAAKRTSYEEIISLLIAADPRAATSDADLIAVCATNGSVRLLEQLCRLNADLSRPDRFGWTPLDLARQFGRKEAEAFLKQQAAWRNLLPSRWGTGFPATTATGASSVVSEGKKILHTSGKRVCVSADRPLPTGLERYYFEVTLLPLHNGQAELPSGNEFPEMAIGFCTLGGAAIEFPGWWAAPDAATTAKSWGYHSDTGVVYSSVEDGPGFDDRVAEEQRYTVGDTVGCGVDLAKGEIWFTKNGTKVPRLVRKGVEGRLFPVVGLHEGVYFETNFGRGEGEEFVWKGEFREVQTEDGMKDEAKGEVTAKVIVVGQRNGEEGENKTGVQVTSQEVVVVAAQ